MIAYGVTPPGFVLPLSPYPFASHDRLGGNYQSAALPAGTSTLAAATVPAGEYWVVTLFNIQTVSATATILRMGGIISGAQVYAIEQRGVVVNQVYINNCTIVLFPTDIIQVNIVGATAGDTLLGRWAGWKVSTN